MNGGLDGSGRTGIQCPLGCGTVFKITPAGTLTTLYSFCSQTNCTDGSYPSGGLTQAANGDFYGTTSAGGSVSLGTVFKINSSGALTTLHSFCEALCSDGRAPNGGLVQAPNGNLYGTTSWGLGTLFSITPDGTLTTLHNFVGGVPQPGLVLAASGNLLGTTNNVGGFGTVFQVTSSGRFKTVYEFCSQAACADGDNPVGLVQGTDGIFYGATSQGGAIGYGTVFALSTEEAPFVLTRPTIGVVGEVVTIIGYGLKDATSVTFNGTSATILYDAATVIYAKVPAGATTGQGPSGHAERDVDEQCSVRSRPIK